MQTYLLDRLDQKPRKCRIPGTRNTDDTQYSVKSDQNFERLKKKMPWDIFFSLEIRRKLTSLSILRIDQTRTTLVLNGQAPDHTDATQYRVIKTLRISKIHGVFFKR